MNKESYRWRIDYDNDKGFSEWWTVTDNKNNEKYCVCNTKEDAEWLCDILNRAAPRKIT